MAKPLTLKQRVEALEREVTALKQRQDELEGKRPWLERIAGSVKDMPEFEEVVRLGREFRQADRPPEED